MADEKPPPYPGGDGGAEKQPGYPPQMAGQAHPAPPQVPYPAATGYPQPTPGYPPQPTPGYPPQPTPGYPPQPTPGYPPQPTPGYPPQPTPGYPPQPTPGYAQQQGQPGYPPPGPGPNKGYHPAPSNYPPPGHTHVQQPMGHMTHNTSTTVILTQQPTVTATVIPYMNDYMGLSIFSCLFCCFFIGVIAIIKSSEARSNYAAGNYERAMASAITARNLSYASIFCGIGMFILIIIVASV